MKQSAPEPFLSACLRVIRMGVFYSRHIASQCDQTNNLKTQQLGDLLHAIHRVVVTVGAWESDAEDAVLATLQKYDDK